MKSDGSSAANGDSKKHLILFFTGISIIYVTRGHYNCIFYEERAMTEQAELINENNDDNDAYKAMAADTEREREADEWCNAYFGPVDSNTTF